MEYTILQKRMQKLDLPRWTPRPMGIRAWAMWRSLGRMIWVAGRTLISFFGNVGRRGRWYWSFWPRSSFLGPRPPGPRPGPKRPARLSWMCHRPVGRFLWRWVLRVWRNWFMPWCIWIHDHPFRCMIFSGNGTISSPLAPGVVVATLGFWGGQASFLEQAFLWH